MPKLKVKVFINAKKDGKDLLEILDKFNLKKEIINTKTVKGKKLAKEWCVRTTPFIFFVADTAKEDLYYSLNTHINRQFIADIIRSLNAKLDIKPTFEGEN